jgi:glycosidase
MLHSFLIPALVVLQSVLAAPLSDEPNRVLYQVYPESFQDAVLNDGSGDFAGLESRLDYLRDLGITGLLLMPSFNDSGGMGYMVNDFRELRYSYTGVQDPAARETVFKHLLDAAHARGIKVMLDIPINHISNASTWFRDSQAGTRGYENYFLWDDEPRKGWRLPWDEKSGPSSVWHRSTKRKQYYYGLFGTGMPDLNHREPAVQAEILAIFSKYAELGVDGYRIDAAKHLAEGKDNLNPLEPENLALLKYYLSELRKKFPNQSFLLEAWAGYDQFEPYLPESGDIAFDFAYMSALRDSSSHDHPWAVRNALNHLVDVQDRLKPGNRIVFVGNHDMARIRTFLGDSRERTEIAQAATLLLPFTPLIYYGDELFMPGDYVHSSDPAKNRNGACTPMAWTPAKNAGFTDPSRDLGDDWNKRIHADWRTYNVETELGDAGSFLSLTREILSARKQVPLTNEARFFVEKGDGSSPVLKYAVKLPGGCCMVGLFNFAKAAAAAVSADFAGACEGSEVSELISHRARHDAASREVKLASYGFWAGRQGRGCSTPK